MYISEQFKHENDIQFSIWCRLW